MLVAYFPGNVMFNFFAISEFDGSRIIINPLNSVVKSLELHNAQVSDLSTIALQFLQAFILITFH